MANVVQMAGIGPFITLPLLVSTMGGRQSLVGWLAGALLAVCAQPFPNCLYGKDMVGFEVIR
ncbi:MAG TPA: hypothetical protein VFA60_12835 [Terriglobales bacterium]|nr:hypothetical protein [Terriglobales bacterium]